MIYLAGILALGFKLWMLMDAIKRGIEYYWYFIIFFIPFGDWAYFILVKLKDVNWRKARSLFFDNTPSPDTLRYNLKMNPCVENKIALAQALQKSDPAEACRLCSEVLQIDTGNIAALFGLGTYHLARKNYAAAAGFLEQILAVNKAALDYEPWLNLAELSWLQGERAAAISRLRDLVATAPRIRHQVLLAKYLADDQQTAEARAILRDVIAGFSYADSFIKQTNRQWFNQARRLLSSLKESGTEN